MRRAVLLVLAGCYSPQPVPGAPCSAASECPSGLVCIDDRCVFPGTNSDGAPDTPATDAPTDALVDAPIDAAPGDAPPNAPRLVQQGTSFSSPATTVTVTLNAAPTAGHTLVAVGGCPTNSLASISGGAATWQRIAFSTVHPNIEVYIGTANGTSSVTVALSTCASQMSLSVSEWENLAAAPFQISVSGDGIASPAAPGSLTTGSGTHLVLFSVADYAPNTFGTPTDGSWDQLLPIEPPASGVEMRTWFRVVGASASIAPTVSETRHEWDATLVSLTGI